MCNKETKISQHAKSLWSPQGYRPPMPTRDKLEALKLIKNIKEKTMEFVDYVNPERTNQDQSKKFKVTVTMENLIDEQYLSTDWYDGGCAADVSIKDFDTVEEFVKALTQNLGAHATPTGRQRNFGTIRIYHLVGKAG